MKSKLALAGLFLLFSSVVISQEGVPVYSDYLSDNWYLLHPSMAGATVHNQIRLTARKQWIGIEDAPSLQTLSINARLSDQSGIGGIVYNDKNGYNSQTGGYLTYAHHLRFSRNEIDLNQLSFGLSVGLTQSRLDETNFDPRDFDPIIQGILQSKSYLNIDAGFSYNYLDFSAHLTVKNLLFSNRALYSDKYESNNQRNYLVSTAYTFGNISSQWSYEPSILLQWRERTGEQAIDLNMKLYRAMDFGKLWGGLSYRRSFDGISYRDGDELKDQQLQYITPIIGTNYKNFVFAYTYSNQIGSLKFDNGGFHQITLGYDFLGGRKLPYDCNCPAVN